jgi:hypothetical protein
VVASQKRMADTIIPQINSSIRLRSGDLDGHPDLPGLPTLLPAASTPTRILPLAIVLPYLASSSKDSCVQCGVAPSCCQIQSSLPTKIQAAEIDYPKNGRAAL